MTLRKRKEGFENTTCVARPRFGLLTTLGSSKSKIFLPPTRSHNKTSVGIIRTVESNIRPRAQAEEPFHLCDGGEQEVVMERKLESQAKVR